MKKLLVVCLLAIGIVGILHLQSQTPAAFPGSYAVVNDTSTGTTYQKLAKISAGKAILSGTGDTTSIGVCVQNCTTTGSAVIAFSGIVGIVQDGNTTADHWVVLSTTVAGDIHDSGATTYPTSGVVIGQVIQANAGGAGVVAQINLNKDMLTPSGGGGGTAFSTNIGSWYPFGFGYNNASQVFAAGANLLSCAEFTAPMGMDLGLLAFYQGNATDSGKHYAFALYSADGNTLIATGSTITSASNTAFTETLAATLVAATTYNLCLSTDSTGGTIPLLLASAGGTFLVSNADTSHPRMFSAANSSGWSGTTPGFPSTLGARTAQSKEPYLIMFGK